MKQSTKNIFEKVVAEFESFKIYNQNLYLHLILVFFLTNSLFCYCQQLSLVDKWDILLRTLDPCFDSKDLELQFQILEYLGCFKQQICADLCMFDSKEEIEQYSKFIKHIVEITHDYYDQLNRDYYTHKLYIQNMHIKQWNYWYQIKFLRP